MGSSYGLDYATLDFFHRYLLQYISFGPSPLLHSIPPTTNKTAAHRSADPHLFLLFINPISPPASSKTGNTQRSSPPLHHENPNPTKNAPTNDRRTTNRLPISPTSPLSPTQFPKIPQPPSHTPPPLPHASHATVVTTPAARAAGGRIWAALVLPGRFHLHGMGFERYFGMRAQGGERLGKQFLEVGAI